MQSQCSGLPHLAFNSLFAMSIFNIDWHDDRVRLVDELLFDNSVNCSVYLDATILRVVCEAAKLSHHRGISRQHYERVSADQVEAITDNMETPETNALPGHGIQPAARIDELKGLQILYQISKEAALPPSRLQVSFVAYEVVAVAIEASLTRGMLGTQVLSIDYQKIEAVLTAAESSCVGVRELRTETDTVRI